MNVRWVISALVSVAVLLAQPVSGDGNHGINSLDGWTEICGDGGSYFVQLDQDGQEQAPECTHCVFCVVPSADVKAVNSASIGTLVSTDFTLINYFADEAVLPVSPEQYWSACRGPPIASPVNNMTISTSLFDKEPFGTVSKSWRKPCV